MTKIARGLLILNFLTFSVIGVMFTFWPIQNANSLNISLNSAMAVTDFRATYGGFDFAIGMFYLFCFFRRELKMGLIASSFVYLGFGSARLLGVIIDGSPTHMILFLLSWEWFFGPLCLWVASRIKS
jgi:hypothetical protein